MEAGVQVARVRALAVLRVRGRALAAALIPAGVAVVLFAGAATGTLGEAGGAWRVARWAVAGVAVVVLAVAVAVALVVARARPALSPTVPIAEESAPGLYRMVRELADRLEVPAPSAIALTPDCDSWLEDRSHPAHAPPTPSPAPETGPGAGAAAAEGPGEDGPGDDGERTRPPGEPRTPVLVIGSPFLWWMRVAELRAVLAPVVAGTGWAVQPDIAAARRFVRGLDAAVAVTSRGGGPLRRALSLAVGPVVRRLLGACRDHAAEMERWVAAAASERAQDVDYGLRIAAQEQVGLAYAGWDRLLTRVALPAWRLGRWPARLDAGVVSALTELSRRDRLAEGYASRLAERPASDLLTEPGDVDRAASLLAARLFHGAPAEAGPGWTPVGWQQYPQEVTSRKWRLDAARLRRVLGDLPAGPGPAPAASPVYAAVRAEGTAAGHGGGHPHAVGGEPPTTSPPASSAGTPTAPSAAPPGTPSAPHRGPSPAPHTAPEPPPSGGAARSPAAHRSTAAGGRQAEPGEPPAAATTLARLIVHLSTDTEAAADVADRLGTELAREEREAASSRPPAGDDAGSPPVWGDGMTGSVPPYLTPLPRTGRELLADHVTALLCCTAVETAGASPGLDWLDGPSLVVRGERRADHGPAVRSLVDEGDAEPLRQWLTSVGVRL
ncbi:hypothetical protein ACFV3R_29245 [Streptomyces sp. NPDC059740]|uniref:hypothetical protein n=1 Tax=Streptomyces sp. NPDC059740 TaxID=3346926 RepID=UPI00365FE8B3